MAVSFVICIVNLAKEAQADTFPPKKENPLNIPARPWQLRKYHPRQGPSATASHFSHRPVAGEAGVLITD